ncbi:MAG: hypothetical protein QM765_40370 [Myxococcales bacterium]
MVAFAGFRYAAAGLTSEGFQRDADTLCLQDLRTISDWLDEYAQRHGGRHPLRRNELN